MGFFNKIKNIFKGNNNSDEKNINSDSSVKTYEKGLCKSREGFVSKLVNLSNKYKSKFGFFTLVIIKAISTFATFGLNKKFFLGKIFII